MHAAARATLAALRTSTAPPESVAAITRGLLFESGVPDGAHHDRAAHIAVGTTVEHLMLAPRPTAPDPVITDWLATRHRRRFQSPSSRLPAQEEAASLELRGALLKRVGPV